MRDDLYGIDKNPNWQESPCCNSRNGENQTSDSQIIEELRGCVSVVNLSLVTELATDRIVKSSALLHRCALFILKEINTPESYRKSV